MEDTMISGSFLDGIGDDVINAVILLVVGILPLLLFLLYNYGNGRNSAPIHADSRTAVENVRSNLPARNANAMTDGNTGHQATCPICLTDVSLPVQTNCSHIFCGRCFTMYWNSSGHLGMMKCPVCRQQVSILLKCFRDGSISADQTQLQSVNETVNRYNRKFSGEPLSWIEYLRDFPTLLRHCLTQFFTVGGLIWMFRLRVIVCFCLAILYFISPLDIIPEAVFGFFGLVDDLFIILLLAIYISVMYRGFIANRARATA